MNSPVSVPHKLTASFLPWVWVQLQSPYVTKRLCGGMETSCSHRLKICTLVPGSILDGPRRQSCFE